MRQPLALMQGFASYWQSNHHLHWSILELQATSCMISHPGYLSQNDSRVILFKLSQTNFPCQDHKQVFSNQTVSLFWPEKPSATLKKKKNVVLQLLTTPSCTGSRTHLKLLCLASHPRLSCKENRTLKSELSWTGQLPSQLLLLSLRLNRSP